MESRSECAYSNQILDENLFQQTTPEMKEKVLEYGRLSQIINPSPDIEKQIDKILDEAINNVLLNFWIEHVDHVLGHHHGLLTEEARESYRSQGLLLKEHLNPNRCSPVLELSQERTNEPKISDIGATSTC